jgi:hypothetical protein
MQSTLLNVRSAYAVAVRDGADLFLFVALARDPLGDVYVNILHQQQGPGWERWKPHTSYHAFGPASS